MRTLRLATRKVLTFCFAGLLSVILWTYLDAHLAAPPPGRTGAPREDDCGGAGCHSAYPVNSGPGQISVGILDYLPDDTLLIGVEMAGTGGSRWGFEAVVLNFGGDTTREIVLTDPERTQILVPPDSARYVAHTPEGSQPIPPDTVIRWQFKAAIPGPIYADGGCPAVFVAAVAADGDLTPAGDYVYAARSMLEIGSCYGCPFTLAGDVNASGYLSSADIIGLVNYVFESGTEPQPCALVADVNCSGTITPGDIIYLVNFVFKGGWAPCDPCEFVSKLLWDC